MIELDELLKLMTPDVVIGIMEECGSPVYDRSIDRKTQQQCLWFQTICHGGDSHKLCFFTETKDFFCYTNCGKMGFFNVIRKIKGFKEDEFGKLVKYLCQKVGLKTSEKKDVFVGKVGTKEIRDEIRELEDYSEYRKRTHKDNKITTFFDPSILKYFDSDTFYKGWIDEGISIKSMRKFGISWYESKKHIIIPHYDMDGKLIGIRRRTLNPEEVEAGCKYMPEYLSGVLYDHPLALNLYGLNENKNAIKRFKKAVIVESEKSVLLSDTYYSKKSVCVATCGFVISDTQLNMLLKLGVEEIVIGFDKDYDVLKEKIYKKDELTYKKYTNYVTRLKTLAKRIAPFCDVYLLIDKEELLGEKDSPLDKGKETFEKLMKHKIKITTDTNLETVF